MQESVTVAQIVEMPYDNSSHWKMLQGTYKFRSCHIIPPLLYLSKHKG